MRSRCRVIAFALSLAVLAAPAALAQEIPLPELQKKLAEKNYYASLEGLKDAQADVRCNIMDQLVAAFPDAAGKPIAVKYYWSKPAPEIAPKKKFVISGIPAEMADLAGRAQQIFQGKEDLVINAPVYETIETTNAQAMTEGAKVKVVGEAKTPADQLRKLQVEIDAATWQVQKMEMDLGQAQATVEMVSQDLGGKWGVESTVVSSPQVKQVMKFEYAQVDGFWLPSKISLDYQGPDGKPLATTFVYDFSNWQVNKGIPEGVL